MMNELKFEHQINNSYMVFQAADNIEDHAIKMMCYHNIPHLIPLKEKTVKGCTYLYYDITNLSCFFDYTKIHSLEYILLKNLVKSLFEVLEVAREFFLSEECFLINEKTLYFDPNSKRLYFLYLPFSTRPYNLHQQLHIMLTGFLQVVNKQDEKAISLIYKLRIIIEEQNFGIKAFKELMEYEDEIINPAAIKVMDNIPVDVVLSEKKADKSHNKEKVKINLNFILSQIMVLAVVFICCNKLIVPEENARLMWIKLIIMLTAISLLEIAIISRILMKNKEQNKVKGIIKFKQDIKNTEKRTVLKKENNVKTVVNKWNWNNSSENKLTPSEGKNERAYLISEEGIKTPIIKTPFIIGKTKGAVDLCIQNELVSRKHCQIINSENNYYLMDLDSCNGSFINEISLESQKKYLLNDGDSIRIGFSTYSFSLV